jgi:hypothetical protein
MSPRRSIIDHLVGKRQPVELPTRNRPADRERYPGISVALCGIDPLSESRVIRPGHWERAQISEMGIIGS